VVRVLNRLVYLRGRPDAMFCDNGAEFTGQIVDLWAYHHKVRMDFSHPGTPTDNAHIEPFNATLRDEFLNVNWFASLAEAQQLAGAWRVDYNESRPHMAHNGKTGRICRNLRPVPWWPGPTCRWILTSGPDHQSQARQKPPD